MTDHDTIAALTSERDELRRKVCELEAKIAELTAPRPPGFVAWFSTDGFCEVQRFDSEHDAALALKCTLDGNQTWEDTIQGALVSAGTASETLRKALGERYPDVEIGKALAAYAEATK